MKYELIFSIKMKRDKSHRFFWSELARQEKYFFQLQENLISRINLEKITRLVLHSYNNQQFSRIKNLV